MFGGHQRAADIILESWKSLFSWKALNTIGIVNDKLTTVGKAGYLLEDATTDEQALMADGAKLQNRKPRLG
ncbi:hypothetical protein O9929_20285 [Vibrio lentus]|nr:hypothetical protein [Vibrio lentus]